MNNPLFRKFAVLALLMLVLMIPLLMVKSAVIERAQYRAEAQRDIARSWGGAQDLVGPVLVQTYEVDVVKEVWDANLERYQERTVREARRVLRFPQGLEIIGHARVEQRYRGIHAVPVYAADLDVNATIAVPVAPAEAMSVSNRLVLGISEVRGFRQQPEFNLAGEPLHVQPGAGDDGQGNGVHAVLDVPPGTYALTAELRLGGTERLAIAPLGDSTTVQLTSNWPHPRFSGGYLPEASEINAGGFDAGWQTSHFATTIRDDVAACLDGECQFADTQLIAVELADPVNIYLLNERSVKYGALFLAVVFGVFLVYEFLKRLRIHPVQYGMVGLGLAIFFLLLLSLSEHVAFGLAYLAGASACVLLLAFYVSHILGGVRRGLEFGALLAMVYGALYVILKSEDHALLLGSVLLFGLLAAAMYLTRNIDWYTLEMPKRNDVAAAQ